MLKNITDNNLLNKIFLIAIFFYLISAINNPFIDINFSSINGAINTFRGIAPYILMPILIVYLLFIEKDLKLDWIYFLFLIYLFGQFLGYIIKPFGFDYHINQQNQIYWLICNFTATLYFYTIRQKKDFNILILKIFILIISIIAIKFLVDVYYEFFEFIEIEQRVINFFYNIHSMSPNRLLFDQPVPRSSGLSRMTLVLFLIIYAQLFFSEHKKNKNILYTLLLAFLVFTIFNLQNRITMFYIFGLIFFTLFFKITNFNFKKKIIYIFLIFLIPFFLHLSFPKISLDIIKTYKDNDGNKILIVKHFATELAHFLFPSNETKVTISDQNKKLTKKPEEKISNITDKQSSFTNSIKRQRLLIKSSTGRKELWDRTLHLFFINKFIGYGPQADRIVLRENVSSLYFYSILCGGIISFFSILIITVILFLKSLKLIFIKKIFISTEKFTCFSLLFIGYLYLRTIVEISFGVFGIDMVLFFLTYNILRNSAYY